MIFSEIKSAIDLWERLRKWYGSLNNDTETVAARFVRLFESHGVHRNQIPRFFGNGLTLKDVQEDSLLISKLDEDLLETACKLFAVRREWLDGAEARAHTEHDFYKRPADFLIFINERKAANIEGELSGELFAPEDASSNAEAILILKEVIGYIGSEQIYRYYLCNNWSFSYWKARAYLTACIAIAWKSHVFIHGTFAPVKSISKLATGEILLGDQKTGVETLHGKKWYPEDMAFNPEVYLKGIDSELNGFGIKSAITLWLDLENQGFMDTGMENNSRKLFNEKAG